MTSMAVYYYIGCTKCKESVALVRQGGLFQMMEGVHDEIPAFMQKHVESGCLSDLIVFNDTGATADDMTPMRFSY